MVLLIDNYDSFTYNLAQSFQVLGVTVQVVRNDTPIQNIPKPQYLVIGPGPGTPAQSGISKPLIEKFLGIVPILGVCLGHQAIGELFGAKIVRAAKPIHGKINPIHHDGKNIFANLPQPLNVVRYNSLIIDKQTLPQCLEISAQSDENEIMAIRHIKHPIEGVQFHPESIASQNGLQILLNFLNLNQKRSYYA